jgi:Protein of unknown function (DUF3891)
MLRLETESGWWLITHPDHARLAGDFAKKWGNDRFVAPEPRRPVLLGISTHDDGWEARDARPQITRQGLPSAFSSELVGKYSAFEEIDLADYLAVRERAVSVVAEADPYAALLVSLHTYNLLTERADRSTISIEQLPLLDTFLERQRLRQQDLYSKLSEDPSYSATETSWPRIQDHFKLLQATDNLSLLSCVDYRKPASLIHALPIANASHCSIAVESLGARHFRLAPYPFSEPELKFQIPARHVEGKNFQSAEELQKRFHSAPVSTLFVTLSE